MPHPTCCFCAQLMTISTFFPGTENPMPERPREKEEPVVRETSEAADCHLGDMLQQLHSVNASKPSERGLVRQGGHCRGPGAGGAACPERTGKPPSRACWPVRGPVSIGLVPPLVIGENPSELA